VLDLSGDMERILCDVDSAGQITAWYVHGPDLAFKVDAIGNLLCYHADVQANIIALTGTNGTALAQYAYTPYGRLLGSTNFSQLSTNNPQPFLFVGSQGVMQELPNLYFMRARYYSAEASVFLSTDPVKNIGPKWKPEAYVYVASNPCRFIDPLGADKTKNVVFSGLVFISGLIVEEAAGIIDKLNRTVEHVQSQIEYSQGDISEYEHAQNVLADQEFIAGEVDKGMESGSKLLKKVYGLSAKLASWAMSDPISANGGTVGNSTPMFAGKYAPTQPKTSGFAPILNKNGPSGSQSVGSKTPGAINYGQVMNTGQQQKPVPTSNNSGSTTGNGPGGGGSGTKPTPTPQPQPPKPPPPKPPTPFQIIGNFFGNLFGGLFGGKK